MWRIKESTRVFRYYSYVHQEEENEKSLQKSRWFGRKETQIKVVPIVKRNREPDEKEDNVLSALVIDLRKKHKFTILHRTEQQTHEKCGSDGQ